MHEEIGTLRSQVIGASTLADRVFNDTEIGKHDQQVEGTAAIHSSSPCGTKMPRSCAFTTPSTQPLIPVPHAPADVCRDIEPLPTKKILSKPCTQSTPPARSSAPAPSDSCRNILSIHSLPWTVAQPAVMPAEYGGKTPWKRYVLQFEAVSRANGWPTDLKTIYLASLLRGTAFVFFETLDPHTRENYDQLSKAFRKRFGTEHQQTVAHIQLRSRVQGLGKISQNSQQTCSG